MLKPERPGRIARCVAIAGLVAMPQAGRADLAVDLRASGGSPGVVVSDGGKGVQAPALGAVVSMGIFARVSGTDGINNESLNIVSGSSISSTGALLGNLVAFTAPPFSETGSSNGTIQDLDGDGDLDVGSPGTAAAGKFSARAVGFAPVTSVIDANTAEILIGTLTFTLIGSTGASEVSFVPRPGTSGGAAQWLEDAVNPKTPADGVFSAMSPVQVVLIPEPGAVAGALVGGLGLLARRGRKTI